MDLTEFSIIEHLIELQQKGHHTKMLQLDYIDYSYRKEIIIQMGMA